MTTAKKAMATVERLLTGSVASAFAVVQAVLLRVVGVVRVLDVLGNLLGPVIRRGQML